jgi:hypothetical protein
MNASTHGSWSLGNVVAGVATCLVTAAVCIAAVAPALGPLQALDATDFERVRATTAAALAYSSDHDLRLPLGHGRSPNGQHGSNFSKYVPHDWPVTSVPLERTEYSRVFVMNTIQPYLADLDALFDRGSQAEEYQPQNPVAPGKTKLQTTYAYNGLLHGYSATAVVAPDKLPLFTGLNGRARVLGWGFANPALSCNFPADPNCSYRPRMASGCVPGNGGSGFVYSTYGNTSYWMYKKGQNWGFVGGHAQWRRLGAQLAPENTDRRVDPLTGYDNTGRASSFWWDDCHPWLFRPDYDFSG